MNSSLDVIPTTANWIKSIWKMCLNLCSRRWQRANLNLVVNLIPLGLWQLKIEFEDSLMNLNILFLKAEKVSEFLIFKSNFFHSMAVDRKKNFWKKLIYQLLLVLALYAFLKLGSVLKRCAEDWPSNILKK